MKLLKYKSYYWMPAALLLAQPAMAGHLPRDYSYTFNDPCGATCSDYTAPGGPLYYGGNGGDTTDLEPGPDVLEQSAPGDSYEFNYDILSMTVAQSGTNLNVSVLTRFQENTAFSTLYGDLLISTDTTEPLQAYSPFGSSPYDSDVITNTGTTWEYAVQTSTGEIYGGPGLVLETSDDADGLGLNEGFYRSNQYVRVASGTDVGDATVTINKLFNLPNPVPGPQYGFPNATGTLLSYVIPLSDLGLSADNPYSLAVRWTMTCANDIIEAAVAYTPESSTLSLLLGGLLGWRLMARKERDGQKIQRLA